MKKFFLIIILFYFNGYAQNYALDSTFATGGVKNENVTSESYQYHKKTILYSNNKYIIAMDRTLLCYNYDGSKDSTFGTNGSLILPTTHTIYGAKLVDQSIYFFGGIHTSGLDSAFLAKATANGVFDTSFGTGGIATFHIGDSESSSGGDFFNDIRVNSDQTIYAIGTAYIGSTTQSYYVLCRITSSQLLDTTFGTMGSINYGYGQGFKIFDYQGGLLLAGMGGYPDFSSRIVHIDLNGNNINSFGVNGILNISKPTDLITPYLVNAYVFGTKLYLSYIIGGAGNATGYVKSYNLLASTTQVMGNISTGRDAYFSEYNGKLYIADGTCAYCYAEAFRVQRLNSDDSPDLTFNSTGQYTYNYTPNAKSFASAIYIHNDGKIFLAGYGGVLTMIRLKETALSITEGNQKNNFTVYPNPASEKLFIKNDFNHPIDKLMIQGLDGKTILTNKSDSTQINIDQLTQGVYFLNIFSEGTIEVFKFIKE
jgi:uncharacterized delta-60 repeat protein